MGRRIEAMFVALCLALTHGPAFAAQSRSSRATKEIGVLTLPEFKRAAKNMSPEAAFTAAALLDIRLEQYPQAIAKIKALLRKNQNPKLWGLLALAYNRQGDWRRAYAAAAKAIALEPKKPAYYLERGIAAYELKAYRHAQQDLSIYVKSNDSDAQARFYLARTQAQSGNLAAAREGFLKVQSLDPDKSIATNYQLGLIEASLGNIPQAKARLRATLKEFKGKDSPEKRELLRALSQLDRPKVAARKSAPAKPAVALKKGSQPDQWLALSALYNQKGNWANAYAAAGEALAAGSKRPERFLQRGVAAFHLKNFSGAQDDLLRYIKSDPKNAQAYFTLGLSQANLNKPDQARENLLKARALNPQGAAQADYYISLIDARQGKLMTAAARLQDNLNRTAGKDPALAKQQKALLAEVQRSDSSQTAAKFEAILKAEDLKTASKSTPQPLPR